MDVPLATTVALIEAKLVDTLPEIAAALKENGQQHRDILARINQADRLFEKHTIEERWHRRVLLLFFALIAGETTGILGALLPLVKGFLFP